MALHFQVSWLNFDLISNLWVIIYKVNAVIPILRRSENSENNVFAQHPALQTFAKEKKYRIPPLSGKIVEVKIKKAHNFQNENLLITICINYFSSSISVSHIWKKGQIMCDNYLKY